MEHRLFSEFPELYHSRKEYPHTIRSRIRMRDLIDRKALREAVDSTMKRYPYLCVELAREEDDWFFRSNDRPVAVRHAVDGVELNTRDSNYHMIAFSWYDNWIVLDVFHGMTDATWAYEVIRTLLYYYCSLRYHVELGEEGIRLAGEPIPEEEWVDSVESADIPEPAFTDPADKAFAPALNLRQALGLEGDHWRVVYSIAVSENEFMRFNIENDGSPATMLALFLSRAIAGLCPGSREPIRVGMFQNLRPALHAPSAHHSLVGRIQLEYKEKLRDWPVARQATAYRGMVYAQSREEHVLAGIARNRGFIRDLMAAESDEERLAMVDSVVNVAREALTVNISYVGKANFREAEQYIRDFRLCTCTSTAPVLVEVSAVNGRFTLDVIQNFESPVLVNALLAEFEENGIRYDLQDVQGLGLSNARLPWSE